MIYKFAVRYCRPAPTQRPAPTGPPSRTMQVASLRPALLFWATALRPLPLHPLMTADNVPPVRAAAPIVSSAPKPDGSGSQLVPKVDEELLAQVSQSLPHRKHMAPAHTLLRSHFWPR